MKNEEPDSNELDEKSRSFYQNVVSEYVNLKAPKPLLFFLTISIAFTFIRLQNLPGLGFLGSISAPAFFGLITLAMYLPFAQRNLAWPIKAILIFLVFQGFRGLLGYTIDADDLIVRNDFHHFHAWKTIVLDMFFLSLPASAVIVSKRAFSYLSKVILFCGVFLSFWGLTHAGRGPGGVVGDENDLCFFILTCFPFGILNLKTSETLTSKILSYLSIFCCLLGVVSTNSRGGMLGFIGMVLFYFLLSPNKFKLITFAVIGIFISIPFLPEEFKSEFTSIQKDVSGNQGTVKNRKEYWKIAWAIFTEPRHIPFGVGMRNVSWWIPVYEKSVLPDAQRGRGGRAVHSMYFELIADLGLFGLFIIGGSLYWSIRSNLKASKYFREARFRLQRASSKIKSSKEPLFLEKEKVLALNGILLKQSKYIENAGLAINASFAGTLVSGIAISVLYYPPIWFLIALSVALQYYSKKIVAQNSEFFSRL